MAKKYTRKQVGSLTELDREQDRIRKMTTKMENEWLDSILNPQQLALSVVTGLLSRRRNKQAAPGLALFSGKRKKKADGTPAKSKVNHVTGAVAGFVKKPVVARVAKRVGVSFLRWQAFNLAWFLGKKAWKAVKERRAEHKHPVLNK